MVTVLDQTGDPDFDASGLYIGHLLRWRHQPFAIVVATPDAFTVTFADSATEAGGMLLSMIRNGLQADDISATLPEPVKDILRSHQYGCH